LSQADNLPLEDLPIHTMKKDLAEIKNPELAKTEIEFQEAESRPQPINRAKLSEAQKTSPFLDFPAPQKPVLEDTRPQTEPVKSDISDSRIKFVEPAPQPEKTAPPIVKVSPPAPRPEKIDAPQNLPVSENEKPIFDSEKNSPATKQHPHHINFNKVFMGVIAILIVAIIAGSGYYFWITRQSTPEVVVTPPITEPEPTPKPAANKFSTDKPNTLTVDMATATNTTLKELLQNTAKDVTASEATLPVEFKLVDSGNNPVAFKAFVSKSGISLSPALMANLSDTFSLFIYNDKTVTRGGLAIDSKNPAALKGLLTLEEKTLVKKVSSTFPIYSSFLTGKVFASSDYNGTAIRYMNIAEDWSVDYAIYNNKLVIGTTKMTLRSVIDYLKPQPN